VAVLAVLFERAVDGIWQEVARAYKDDTGMNVVEKWYRSAAIIPDKSLKDTYLSVFTRAALAVIQ